MAHFARIKNGVVDFVTVGRDDDENREDELAHDGWIYKRTSYNTSGGVHANLAAHLFAKTTLALDIATMQSVMRSFHPSHTTHGY
jgi:hypothetical protein